MTKTLKQVFTVLATVFTTFVFAVAAMETVAQDDDPPAWRCTPYGASNEACAFVCGPVEPRGDLGEGEWACRWFHLDCNPNNPECISPRH